MKNSISKYYSLPITLGLIFFSSTMLQAKDKEQQVPRFASLKSSKTNMRVGPNKDYPIRWEYHKKHLPIEIIDEHYSWRKIRDHDGEVGWIHQIMITNTRNVIIMGKGIHALRHTPELSSPAVLRAEDGVIARVIICQPSWCQLQISGRKGWIPRGSLWGLYEGEIFKS